MVLTVHKRFKGGCSFSLLLMFWTTINHENPFYSITCLTFYDDVIKLFIITQEKECEEKNVTDVSRSRFF